jgi:peptide/nickel transport system substrate-binding protein
MRTRNSAAKLTALIAAVAFLAIGCSSSAKSTPAAVPTLPPSNTNATPYSKVLSGGTFRISMGAYPSQWNFNQDDGTTEAVSEVMSALMPTPFTSDSSGNPIADPDYISSYKLTPPSGGQLETIELHLNTKAVWSDGTPITANDYITQWKALNGSNSAFDPSGTTGYNDIKSVVQGSSPYDVLYTLSTPFGEWSSLFGMIFPAKYNATPQEFDKGYLNQIPVTGGPFIVQSLNSSNQTVTLARNPHFWAPPAKLSTIVFENLSEDAAVQAAANGELDDVEVYNVSEYDKLKNTPGLTARSAISELWPALMFNGKNAILSSTDVRDALQEAVDRPAIISSQLKGLPVPAVQPLQNHILLPNQVGYTNNSGQYGTYSPANAEKLLTAAGWAPGAGGVRYKNGQPLAITMQLQSGDTVGASIAQLIQVMWKQIGVKLTLQTINADDYFDNYITEGNFEVGLWEWDDSPDTVSGSQPVYQQWQGTNTFQNFGDIGSPAIDKLFDQALGETDPAQAHATADKVDALIWAEGWGLPLFTEPDIEMQATYLANWGAFGMSLPDYDDVGYTKLPAS